MITATACLFVLYLGISGGGVYTISKIWDSLYIYIFFEICIETKFHIRLTGNGTKNWWRNYFTFFYGNVCEDKAFISY